MTANSKETIERLEKISSQVRRDIVRMVSAAHSGHPGGSMSSADILVALYFQVMEHDPQNWDRSGSGQDVFHLSAGHMSPVLYSVLARSGYFPLSLLGGFRRFGSPIQGCPSVDGHLSGVVQTSGSLGQGLSAAAGFALAKKIDGDEHFCYVLCGDGECEEGQIWEAAQFAVNHHLDNLIALIDWNGQQIDGPMEDAAGEEAFPRKWAVYGWKVLVADGHDFGSILEAFGEARANRGTGRPTVILFRTEMGQGVDFMQGTNEWHGKSPSEVECEMALSQLEETMGDYPDEEIYE